MKQVPAQHKLNDNKDIEKGNEQIPTYISLETSPKSFIEVVAIALSYILFVITFPLAVCFAFKQVQQYERGIKFRLGHLLPGQHGPGLCFILPCVDEMEVIDLRTLSLNIPPQDALTRDAVSVQVDAAIFYSVHNPIMAVNNVENYRNSSLLLATTTLRNTIGSHSLAELLSSREEISQTIFHTLDKATHPWGVTVHRVEIKDVSLPVQMQRAMAAEAEATRDARARVIAAEGEMKASKALKEASDIVENNPSALQLRYLQTLQSISSEKNSTVIFPFPLDMLGAFSKHK